MLRIAIAILLLISACYPNKTDKHFRRQGRWKMCYDDTKKQTMWTGRYQNHEQAGTWKYYTSSGKLYLKEKYRKHHSIKTTYYYPNGKRQLQGFAVYFETEDTTFYRWEGDWFKYDSITGKLMEVSYYKFGKFAWYKPLNTPKRR
jgi:antitoxin component YwqK of YwqJK toxin-antitoxin module